MSVRVRLPRVSLPVEPPRRKRVVYVVAFFSSYCPHCRAVFDDEDSAWNRALRRLGEMGIEVRVRWVDASTEAGALEAREAGVTAVPAVFVNGERLPGELLRDERRLVEVLSGRMPIPAREERKSWWFARW